MPFVTLLLTLFFSTSSQAAPATPEIRENRQQLQQTLEMLERSAREREQQRQRMEKLNQQLKCNLTLINAYKDCDLRYKDQPNARFNCVQAAKKQRENCSNAPDNP